jgi:hypothetical protein
VTLAVPACASFATDDGIPDAGAPDAGADGTIRGGPVVPEGCDVTAEPKFAPRCVAEGLGVFVDATNGDDANAGTRAQPVKTIAAGLTRLQGKPRLYL